MVDILEFLADKDQITTRIVYKYDDDFHEDFQVSDRLNIEYY